MTGFCLHCRDNWSSRRSAHLTQTMTCPLPSSLNPMMTTLTLYQSRGLSVHWTSLLTLPLPANPCTTQLPPPLPSRLGRFASSPTQACQAEATLPGLGAAAHGPRAGFIACGGEGSQGSEAQQQSNQSKKRGRPKGSKNRSKPEAASEAAGAGPAADSAPKTKTPRRPSAKKRKKASDQAAEGPSEPVVVTL